MRVRFDLLPATQRHADKCIDDDEAVPSQPKSLSLRPTPHGFVRRRRPESADRKVQQIDGEQDRQCEPDFSSSLAHAFAPE